MAMMPVYVIDHVMFRCGIRYKRVTYGRTRFNIAHHKLWSLFGMTHAGQERVANGGAQAEQTAPYACEASIKATQQVIDPLLAELGDPRSVFYDIAAERVAHADPETRLGIVPSLLVDPLRSSVRVARHRLQDGGLPADAAPATADEAVVLWYALDKNAIPELRVPESMEERVMAVADSIQMRGGGPLIFHRGEVARLGVTDNTVVHIKGAARNACRERIQTALAVAQETDLRHPLIATVDLTRLLRDDERKAVESFAPNAKNEYQLFLDSARNQGFTLDTSPYGVDTLPDGSLYVTMTHDSGQKMIVFAPTAQRDETGKKRAGVFNDYSMFQLHQQQISEITDATGQVVFPDGFSWQGKDVVHVTSTHYGPMAALNNLEAVAELGMQVGSFKVIGDNQPGRTAQAHFIEIGNLLNKADRLMTEEPSLRAQLLSASS
jgi:hypothetical protein